MNKQIKITVARFTLTLSVLTHEDKGTFKRDARGCFFLDPVTRRPARNNDGTGKVAHVVGIRLETPSRMSTGVSFGGLRTGTLARPWFLFTSDHIARRFGKHFEPDCTTPAGVPEHWHYVGWLGNHLYC